jgi:hypothetical protein
MTSPAMRQTQRSFAGFDGNTFGVRWLRVFDLQFHATEHLKNVMNEDKPVKISRCAMRMPACVRCAALPLNEAQSADQGPGGT